MYRNPFKRCVCLFLCAALALCLLPLSACARGEVRDLCAIAAEYEEGVLRGQMRFTYHNRTEEPLASLCFNLYGNAFREGAAYAPVAAADRASAYYAGESYGGMEVLSVSPCASWEVCGEDENVLRVGLEGELFPDEAVTVEIGWELTLASVNHRTGVAEGAVNLGNFYPAPCVYEAGQGFAECVYSSNGDPFYSACADYEVTFTAPASFIVAASGEVLSASQRGNKKVYTYALSNARDFALCLSEGFSVAMGEACGVPVAWYYLQDEDPQASLALLEECFAYYYKAFGAYPYAQFSAAQTGFCYGGMEYPGLVFISSDAAGEDLLYTLAHETAHQWWYAAVGSDQTKDAWMDEGPAEYSALLFFESAPHYGVSAAARLDAARRACRALASVQEQVFGRADTSMNRPLTAYGGYEYVVLTYCRGALLFDTLRDALGDKRFFSALRRYFAAYAGDIARPEELAACFGSASAVVESFVTGEAVV